jgi:nucleoside-diphosphate-sugar epimerase
VAAVIHCAAKGGDWGDYDEFRRCNEVATRLMVAEAVRLHAHQQQRHCSTLLARFVHVSTVDVYPHQVTPAQCVESRVVVRSEGRRYGYTTTKARAEELVLEAVREHELPACIVRPAAVYGAGSYSWGLVEARVMRQGRGFLVGGSRFASGLVHVRDVAAGVLCALDAPLERVLARAYNLADPRVHWRTFYDRLAQHLDLPPVRRSFPYWLLYLGALVLEFVWHTFKLDCRPLITLFLLRLIGQPQLWPIDAAKRDLAWEPREPFEARMKEQCDWLKRTGLYLDD